MTIRFRSRRKIIGNPEQYREPFVDGNELYIVLRGYGAKEFTANGFIPVHEFTWNFILVQPIGTEEISCAIEQIHIISVYAK